MKIAPKTTIDLKDQLDNQQKHALMQKVNFECKHKKIYVK